MGLGPLLCLLEGEGCIRATVVLIGVDMQDLFVGSRECASVGKAKSVRWSFSLERHSERVDEQGQQRLQESCSTKDNVPDGL